MAVDKLVDSTQLNSDLTSIANAIRTKGDTSAQLAFPSGFVTAIQNIPSGSGESIVITDVPNATGTTLVVTGEEVTLTTKSITQNGTYNASSDNADGYSSVTVNVSGGGGTPSATQHSIYLEFSDGTDTTIPVYYNDALLSTMITAYTPETYGQKTVDLAQLDGVTWYTRPTETWITIFDGNADLLTDEPYGYWWIPSIQDIYPTNGSVWRITIDSVVFSNIVAIDHNDGYGPMIGNPLYSGGQDDGSGLYFNFFNAGWGAWSGGGGTPLVKTNGYSIKIEQLVSV